MALTSSKTVYRQSFGPLPSGAVVAPYPYCLHCKARQAAGGLGYEVRPKSTFLFFGGAGGLPGGWALGEERAWVWEGAQGSRGGRG